MIARYLMFLICSILILSCRIHQNANLRDTGPAIEVKQNLTYEDKFDSLISLTQKYPQEEDFVRSYYSLTEGAFNLADSLSMNFLKESKGESSIDYFSKDKSVDRFYLYLLKLHSLGKVKIQDLGRKEKLDNIFAKTTSSKGTSDWLDKLFKDKSMAESIAEFRQIQTDCLVTRDLVFDDMIDKMTKR
jgi:hypothetical protein